MVARLGQYSDKTVTNIDIPDRIEHNGQSYAVISIPNAAFHSCKELTEITIPNGIKTIGSQAFALCESLTKVNLPDSLTAIKTLTFRDCKKLTEVVIPRGVKEIQNSAFLGCSNLKKVTISSNDLIEIGSLAFRNCEKLAELRIADGVSIIGSQAFLGCKSLTKLTLPDSVTVIKDAAFMNCHNLTEIKFSKNLRKIEDNVFAGVSKLKDIYYNGTKSEWETIEIGDFYNDALQTATVHLADGTTIPGVTPGNPGTTPGTPGNPSNPGTATPPSVTPPVPGTPGTPGNPSNPGTATPPSVTPYVPNEPGTPSVPSSPNTPNTSNKPSTPSTPNKPADKNNPKEPGKEHTTPQTLTAVKTALTEKLTKSENLAPTAFADTEKHWAKESIQFVNKLGILKGIKETEFAPNEAMTRAMFITALGRLGNVNEQDYSASSFGDVPADAYYRSFAEWAKTAGISSGTQIGSFAPNQPISREQIAAMIFRFAKYLGYELPAVQAKAAFADEAQISSWAKEAVIALQQAGILHGKGNQMFDPQGKATRAEIAALLQRLVQAIIK